MRNTMARQQQQVEHVMPNLTTRWKTQSRHEDQFFSLARQLLVNVSKKRDKLRPPAMLPQSKQHSPHASVAVIVICRQRVHVLQLRDSEEAPSLSSSKRSSSLSSLTSSWSSVTVKSSTFARVHKTRTTTKKNMLLLARAQ